MINLETSKLADKNMLIFLGGAHSVGKSTVLNELRRKESIDSINIVSMSDTIHKASMERYSKSIVELNQDPILRDKLQYAIISSLKELQYSFTILDGHYIATDPVGPISANYNTNENYMIRFNAQVVLTAKPETILARRLVKNQGIWSTSIESIRSEQEMEISESKRIGSIFNTPVYVIDNDDAGAKDTAEKIWKIMITLKTIGMNLNAND